jgi:hypothetical protein
LFLLLCRLGTSSPFNATLFLNCQQLPPNCWTFSKDSSPAVLCFLHVVGRHQAKRPSGFRAGYYHHGYAEHYDYAHDKRFG